jgi:hypothetical protein
MAATINLGKDYTISGAVENISDLTVKVEAEKVDATTRFGTLPLKRYLAGLQKLTFECTVLAETATTFDIGGQVAVTTADYTGNLIVTKAPRSEPQDGFVTYKLTMTTGTASANPITV